MKLALIVPPQALELLDYLHLSYHMVLGQALVRNAATRRFYEERHHRGDFIMVDNGAAEPEKERAPFVDIVRVADCIGADEIVMPDSLRNMNETLTLATNKDIMKLVDPFRRCLVPQGETWAEWSWCLDFMVERICFATIGVPKHLERLEGGRRHALRLICSRGYYRHHNVHMFGVWRFPISETRTARLVYPMVRGIDTAAPIAYAQNDAHLSDEEHYSVDWNAEVDMGRAIVNTKVLLEHTHACKPN